MATTEATNEAKQLTTQGVLRCPDRTRMQVRVQVHRILTV